MKCSACKIIAHANCISVLIDKGAQLACKPTFRDVGVRQYREQTRTHHHWVHRRTEKGKCKQCGKVSTRTLLKRSLGAIGCGLLIKYLTIHPLSHTQILNLDKMNCFTICCAIMMICVIYEMSFFWFSESKHTIVMTSLNFIRN